MKQNPQGPTSQAVAGLLGGLFFGILLAFSVWPHLHSMIVCDLVVIACAGSCCWFGHWADNQKLNAAVARAERETQRQSRRREKKQSKQERAKTDTQDLVRRFNLKESPDVPDWLYYPTIVICTVGIIGVVLWFVWFVFLAPRS